MEQHSLIRITAVVIIPVYQGTWFPEPTGGCTWNGTSDVRFTGAGPGSEDIMLMMVQV